MAFVRKKGNIYPWPVEVKRPSLDTPGEFDVDKFIGKFKRLKRSELDNFDTDDKNEELREDIDSIFEVLEGAVDKYYNKLEAAKKKQPDMEW